MVHKTLHKKTVHKTLHKKTVDWARQTPLKLGMNLCNPNHYPKSWDKYIQTHDSTM